MKLISSPAVNFVIVKDPQRLHPILVKVYYKNGLRRENWDLLGTHTFDFNSDDEKDKWRRYMRKIWDLKLPLELVSISTPQEKTVVRSLNDQARFSRKLTKIYNAYQDRKKELDNDIFSTILKDNLKKELRETIKKAEIIYNTSISKISHPIKNLL